MEKQLKVRDLRQKEKFVINDVYLDRHARILGVTASAVYMSLCRHADRNQECFPSQELIAREHNISPRSVKRAIKRLKEANMILIRRERLGHGRWRNNVYVLLDRGQWRSPEGLRGLWTTRGQNRHRPGDNNDRTRGHHSPTKETHKKDTHKKDTHIKDIGEIDIFSLNEEGGWFRPGTPRSDKEMEREDEIRRRLTGIRKELTEKLGWEPKGS